MYYGTENRTGSIIQKEGGVEIQFLGPAEIMHAWLGLETCSQYLLGVMSPVGNSAKRNKNQIIINKVSAVCCKVKKKTLQQKGTRR